MHFLQRTSFLGYLLYRGPDGEIVQCSCKLNIKRESCIRIIMKLAERQFFNYTLIAYEE
jgi:hypothetical protein